MAQYVIHSLFPEGKIVEVGSYPEIPKGFYVTLEGEGVCGGDVLFGTDVLLIFHIPALTIQDTEIELGFSVIPCGFHYPKNSEKWYQTVRVPCKETEICFLLRAPTLKQWKNEVTPGFSFCLDAEGLIVFQKFILPVRPVKSSCYLPKPTFEKIDFDLENKIEGIVKRLRKFYKDFGKRTYI